MNGKDERKVSIKSGRSSNKIHVINFEVENKDKESSDSVSNLPVQRSSLTRETQNMSTLTNTFKLNLNDFPNAIGLFGIGIIGGMSLLTLVTTWWPQHNVILYPEFWYEPVPIFIYMYTLAAPMYLLRGRILLNIKERSTFKSIVGYCCVEWLGNGVTYVMIYFFWVKYLGFPHPIMPRLGPIWVGLRSLVIVPFSLSIMFLSEIVANGTEFGKKICSFIILDLMGFFSGIGYALVPGLPFVQQENLQWILCILILFDTFMNARSLRTLIRLHR